MIFFNFVIGTKGKGPDYLNRLLASIDEGTDGLDVNIVIVIVDQNRSDEVFKFLNKDINGELLYICDTGTGLSRARNVGLEALKLVMVPDCQNLVLFPDDDCFYGDGFFWRLIEYFTDSKLVLVAGKVFDDQDAHTPLGYTPLTGQHRLGPYNIRKGITSINFCIRYDELTIFDERFGIGGYFNSSEEHDYVLAAMGNLDEGELIYDDQLIVFHPNFMNESLRSGLVKVFQNSLGHGACYAKNGFVFYALLISFVYPFVSFIKYLSLFRFKESLFSICSFLPRVYGLIRFYLLR